MSNETYISFYLNSSRIHIFRKAIKEIGNPKFIRFLVKEDGKSMIMEAYIKKDFHKIQKKRMSLHFMDTLFKFSLMFVNI